ncbi:catabolic 3-dehydroquinase [Alternaria alternata]|nr:catabolic 3-dehydroquinase [Alternaria alternata]
MANQHAPEAIASHIIRLKPYRLGTERVLIATCREVGRHSLRLEARRPIVRVGVRTFPFPKATGISERAYTERIRDTKDRSVVLSQSLPTSPNMPKSILLINGPNLNLLGTREPTIYGSTSLSDVITSAHTQCTERSVNFSHIQSNHEGVLVDRIHEARGKVDFVVINPGALTHTSVALRDALAGVEIPFVEVHISNIHKREAFRHHSYLSDKAEAVICGLGVYGYEAAIEFAVRYLKEKDEKKANL